MQILNVRLGHACNSSSSHSLVILPGAKDDYSNSDLQEYDWENFTLASPKAKLDYLSQQIFRVMRHTMNDEIAYSIALGLTFVPPNRDGFIDHQSVWNGFPTTWNNDEIDLDFLIAFRDYILRDGIVILGGNDNSSGHPLSDSPKKLPLTHQVLSGNANVTRYDPNLDAWVLFNRINGTKIRLTFSNEVLDIDIPHADLNKAVAPELVDVKITDNCPYECNHCYQGSTKNAAHADYKFLESLLDDLAEQHVFEVAYGGGEPTVYPEFLKLLHETKRRNIVPNFTTRNLTFIKNHANELANIVGKIAFSVDFPDEIAAFKTHVIKLSKLNANVFALTKKNTWHKVVGVQHVVGSVSQDMLVDLLKFCKENWIEITLLGWKMTGRGTKIQHPNVNWRKACIDANVRKISIDTALARNTDMSKFDSKTYHTTEGSVSCYVDAVERKIGPSSYASSLLMKPYSKLIDNWKHIRVEHGSKQNI